MKAFAVFDSRKLEEFEFAEFFLKWGDALEIKESMGNQSEFFEIREININE